ncbi:hypothetical protein HETIRDRAFT_458800 [Heterobasidion irregulare TC 32-1]|uniref:Uncharacterized protein n=1 Tax=Heterobasidion irregulare (strain TC 32-1) TaxID=747525 RepID=W4K7G0_HETIT|nr:uncharacterized protein HETIRDRAFT_458800 [Heterobasidion irregulare TC 32-1]ETW81265.1 hypothetical protein HETIRDRAFT_458800 [Heterobasidion irregulare TC 32-1]
MGAKDLTSPPARPPQPLTCSLGVVHTHPFDPTPAPITVSFGVLHGFHGDGVPLHQRPYAHAARWHANHRKCPSVNDDDNEGDQDDDDNDNDAEEDDAEEQRRRRKDKGEQRGHKRGTSSFFASTCTSVPPALVQYIPPSLGSLLPAPTAVSFDTIHGLHGSGVPFHQHPRTNATRRGGKARQRGGGREGAQKREETDDEDITIGTSSLAPVPLPYTHTSRPRPPLHVALNGLFLDSTRPLLSSAQPHPPPTRSPVRPALSFDPLSRLTRSPVRPSRPDRSLCYPPRSPRTISCPLARWPTGRLARIVHIASRIAWLDTTTVHHPDTSSASSTFPLPPPPPPLAGGRDCTVQDQSKPISATSTALLRAALLDQAAAAAFASASSRPGRCRLGRHRLDDTDSTTPTRRHRLDDTDSTTPTRRHRLDDTDSTTPTRRHRLGDADSTTPPRPYRLDAALSRPRRRLNASVSILTPDDDTRFAATASDDLDSTPPPRLYRLDATPSTARLDHTSTLPGADDGPRLDNAASTSDPHHAAASTLPPPLPVPCLDNGASPEAPHSTAPPHAFIHPACSSTTTAPARHDGPDDDTEASALPPARSVPMTPGVQQPSRSCQLFTLPPARRLYTPGADHLTAWTLPPRARYRDRQRRGLDGPASSPTRRRRLPLAAFSSLPTVAPRGRGVARCLVMHNRGLVNRGVEDVPMTTASSPSLPHVGPPTQGSGRALMWRPPGADPS